MKAGSQSKQSKQDALKTSVLDIPNLSSQSKKKIIELLLGDRYWAIKEALPSQRRKTQRALLEHFREVKGLCLSDVRNRWPWVLPYAGRTQIVRFALNCGLTRVDWLVLPYDENVVMAQLRTMDVKEVRALPALVLGFLNRSPVRQWLYEVCGVSREEKRESKATIGAFLFSEIRMESEVVGSVPFARLQRLLRDLKFDPKLFPVLMTQREALISSLVREDGCTREEAQKFIAIAERGLIHKKALK